MIHDSAASGYRRNAGTYAGIRPSYHPALLQRFESVCPDRRATLVELGAGTGIFTRQLLDAGYLPIAVEPVAEMRAQLQQRMSGVDVRAGTAESTGLEKDSVDAVVAAQAFHWFDHARALAEIRRILRDDGLLACFWNVRDESVDWVRQYEALVNRHEKGTPRHRNQHWRRAIEADSHFSLIEEWHVPNPQPASAEKVLTRALSTSFVAALEPEVQQGLLDELRALVAPLGSTFEFPYRSEIQVWRRSGSPTMRA